MNHIDNEIYNIFDGAVVRRRKSIVFPAVLLAVGIVSLVVGNGASSEDLSFGLMLCGGVLALSGLVTLIVRVAGHQYQPYYTPAGEVMQRREVYFAYENLEYLRSAVASGRHPEACGIPSVDSSNVMLVCYEAPRCGILVCQVLTYVPHEYRPASEIAVIRK
ncbi:MAG: hypothetical protein IJ014_05005 [Rikenellaceae bacterium]|nr:hypothetical protein [Rikenellaceae bacterium]